MWWLSSTMAAFSPTQPPDTAERKKLHLVPGIERIEPWNTSSGTGASPVKRRQISLESLLINWSSGQSPYTPSQNSMDACLADDAKVAEPWDKVCFKSGTRSTPGIILVPRMMALALGLALKSVMVAVETGFFGSGPAFRSACDYQYPP